MEFKNEIENECAFHIRNNNGFCSSGEIVNKLMDFIIEKSLETPLKKPLENPLEKQKKIEESNVLKTLKDKYNCNTEECVLKQYDIKEYISPHIIEENIQKNFKPEGPKCNKEWLSNINIDNVLSQMKKKYENKRFLHIPFQMRDFMKNNTELAQLNWSKMYNNGYRTFGTVINTDYSTGNGIHWFAIFGDFQPENDYYTIEYFNSSGELPLPEISFWMKKLRNELEEDDQFKNSGKEIKDIIVTRIINQKSSSECGLYSLYYIISRLDGIPFTWFKTNRVPDEKMYLFRQYLFRKS